jgi:hypothetical protein
MICGQRKWHNLNLLIQSLYFWFHALELSNVLLTQMSIYFSYITNFQETGMQIQNGKPKHPIKQRIKIKLNY